MTRRVILPAAVGGVLVGITLTILVAVALELRDTIPRGTTVRKAIPQSATVPRASTPGVTAPSQSLPQWEWIMCPNPVMGLNVVGAMATDGPITAAEATAIGDHLLTSTYTLGVKFAIYFDANFARRELIANDGSRCQNNLFYHSMWEPRVPTDQRQWVEESDPLTRLSKWRSYWGIHRYDNRVIRDASFFDGTLSVQVCGPDGLGVLLPPRAISSVTEIWWTIAEQVLGGCAPGGLLVYFYDLDLLEVDVCGLPDGPVIAHFTAPRRALDMALSAHIHPINYKSAYWDRVDALQNQKAIAAITPEQYAIQRQWIDQEYLSHYQTWFETMAAFEAALELKRPLPTQPARDFHPNGS